MRDLAAAVQQNLSYLTQHPSQGVKRIRAYVGSILLNCSLEDSGSSTFSMVLLLSCCCSPGLQLGSISGVVVPYSLFCNMYNVGLEPVRACRYCCSSWPLIWNIIKNINMPPYGHNILIFSSVSFILQLKTDEGME